MSEVSSESLEQDGTQKLSKMQKFKKEAKSITFIIIAVLAFRSTFFEPFKIPSGSMIPTLLIGDFILVNKFSYGFKVPFSDWFSDPIYITGPDQPDRGDVVVFKYPNDTSLNYIKRVVGLPGDTVQMINRVIYINDQPIEATPIEASAFMEDMDEKYKVYNLEFFKTKTGDAEHITQIDADNYYSSDFSKLEVPKGHYFVMGDNRDFSADSRSWGFVPFGHIKGKAVLIWFSTNIPFPGADAGDVFTFRPWRIGNLIK